MSGEEGPFEGYCRRLGDKLRLLDLFRNETDNVKRLLDVGEIESLNPRLKARRRLVDQISRVDKEIETFMKTAAPAVGECPQRIKDLIRDYMNQIRDTLASISVVNSELQEVAIRQRDTMKDDILEMKRGVTATKGYGAGSYAQSRFVDVRR